MKLRDEYFLNPEIIKRKTMQVPCLILKVKRKLIEGLSSKTCLEVMCWREIAFKVIVSISYKLRKCNTFFYLCSITTNSVLLKGPITVKRLGKTGLIESFVIDTSTSYRHFAIYLNFIRAFMFTEASACWGSSLLFLHSLEKQTHLFDFSINRTHLYPMLCCM